MMLSDDDDDSDVAVRQARPGRQAVGRAERQVDEKHYIAMI